MRVTARRKIGRHPIGETFEVTAKDGKVLLLLRLVTLADDTIPADTPRRRYRRRDMHPEQADEETS